MSALSSHHNHSLAAYLDYLNPQQRLAVETLDGPTLVLAGAGTGKTRVLTTRLAHLLTTGRAHPNQILALTFTNKAAREMKERVAAMLGRPVENWWIGTFHSIAARLLRQYAELVGLQSSFTILDTDDVIRLLKQILSAENIDEKKTSAKILASIIDYWKDRGLTPHNLPPSERIDFAGHPAQKFYEIYQQRLRTLNCVDFGDLLLHLLIIFNKHPDVLRTLQERFHYILVDEYQDTNVAQYLWLRALANDPQQNRNICCVGDDDQSIYSWRGAEIGNILRFEKDFPGATTIRLEQNYRSTPEILEAASCLIAHNKGRLGKKLWTEAPAGQKIEIWATRDGQEEARQVADKILTLNQQGHPFSSMAILVRASFQTREFEERFITLGLPYKVIGGLRFYERQEIRDAIAYLRVVAQPSDDLAFERIINVPKRGIGQATMQVLHTTARHQNIPLFEAAELLVQTDELKPSARQKLATLIRDFYRWRQEADLQKPEELASIVLDESGYTAALQADKTPEAAARLENLKEFVRAIQEFESLYGFLEHVSLVMENVEDKNRQQVSLMTLHSAKGLEFNVVFLPGWEEGIFPHQKALLESGLKALEEERRLAYVGLTRAQHRVFISYAMGRRIYNTWQQSIASRFLDELPKEAISIKRSWQNQAGNYYYGGHSPKRPMQLHETTYLQSHISSPSSTSSHDAFAKGTRVFHQKFGYGMVLDDSGDKLEIDFEKAGVKKVMKGFVTLNP